jgi:hypothetical protein
MEQIFQIIDEAKTIKEKIKSAFNEDKIDKILLASWIEKTVEIEESLAKKIEELTQRLCKFEQEVREE